MSSRAVFERFELAYVSACKNCSSAAFKMLLFCVYFMTDAERVCVRELVVVVVFCRLRWHVILKRH